MDESPKTEKNQSVWTYTLSGKAKWFGYFAVFAVLLFGLLIIEGEGIGSDGENLFTKRFWIKVLGLSVTVLLLLVAYALVRWFCRWLNLRRFLLVTGCLLALIILAYTFENWRGRRAWAAHKSLWEAKGEIFDLAQLVPPPVPDDQNLALAPLLKSLMEYDDTPRGLVWRDTNALARLDRLSPFLSDGRGYDQVILGRLEKGTFANLAACRDFYRGNTNYPQPNSAGTPAADILFSLAKADPELAELRRDAAARPYSRFAVHYQHKPPWGILLRHLAEVKMLCMMTHIRAVVHLELKQSNEAFEDLNLALRVADSIRDEPMGVSHSVRISMMALSLQILREALIRHSWNDTQLAQLGEKIAAQDLLAEHKLAMRGERAFAIAGLDWMRREGCWLGSPGFTGEDRLDPIAKLIPDGWYYQNMLNISEIFQQKWIPIVDEKMRRVLPELAGKSCELPSRWRPYMTFVSLLTSDSSATAMRSGRMQTFIDAGRVACALERYRMAEGNLPESLSALTPRFIEKIPNDVIDGQPLRYQHQANGGYALYSIGWNMKDDHGKIVLTDSKPLGVRITEGDWVWQMPKTLSDAIEPQYVVEHPKLSLAE